MWVFSFLNFIWSPVSSTAFLEETIELWNLVCDLYFLIQQTLYMCALQHKSGRFHTYLSDCDIGYVIQCLSAATYLLSFGSIFGGVTYRSCIMSWFIGVSSHYVCVCVCEFVWDISLHPRVAVCLVMSVLDYWICVSGADAAFRPPVNILTSNESGPEELSLALHTRNQLSELHNSAFQSTGWQRMYSTAQHRVI